MYSSYTAASFARKHDIADKHGVSLEGALTWAFEFEDQPYFDGFRVLATNDIDLPVLNVFRMFALMSGQRFETQSSAQIPLEKVIKEGVRGDPDVGALASMERDKLCIFAWHYHDDDVLGLSASISIVLEGLVWKVNNRSKLSHFRIDEKHSNSFTEWKSMGSPQHPNDEQYAALTAAGKLATLDETKTAIEIKDGQTTLSFDLPRQGVSLLVLEQAS
jgi:xylan 1,4-beta-xylosidase